MHTAQWRHLAGFFIETFFLPNVFHVKALRRNELFSAGYGCFPIRQILFWNPQVLAKKNNHTTLLFFKYILCRIGRSGGEGAYSPRFGRSENGGGSTGAPYYYSPLQIFRPSAIPDHIDDVIFAFDTNTNGNLKCIPCNIQSLKYPVTSYSTSQSYKSCARSWWP